MGLYLEQVLSKNCSFGLHSGRNLLTLLMITTDGSIVGLCSLFILPMPDASYFISKKRLSVEPIWLNAKTFGKKPFFLRKDTRIFIGTTF